MKKRTTILIAEDNDLNYHYLEIVLRKDHNLLWAKNGKEAVEMALAADDISLVLMDHMMPELTGIEALKLIKAQKPQLPVVLLTAFDFDSGRNEALNEGADFYVSKPIRLKDLKELIAKIFNNDK